MSRKCGDDREGDRPIPFCPSGIRWDLDGARHGTDRDDIGDDKVGPGRHTDGNYSASSHASSRRSPRLDDWGLGAIRDQDRRDLPERLEDRTGTRATNVTSQLPSATWRHYLADPTNRLVPADCDAVRRHGAREILRWGRERRPTVKRAAHKDCSGRKSRRS